MRLEHSSGRALRLGQTWEVAAWETAYLKSCHLGKYPRGDATWENDFGKVPNIHHKPLVSFTYAPGRANKKWSIQLCLSIQVFEKYINLLRNFTEKNANHS